jgi:nitrate reductase NapE
MIGMWFCTERSRTHWRLLFGERMNTGDRDVNSQASGHPAPAGAESSGPRREWHKFLLLAFVGLPVTMVLAIASYGFVVWFLQILFFGPPS